MWILFSPKEWMKQYKTQKDRRSGKRIASLSGCWPRPSGIGCFSCNMTTVTRPFLLGVRRCWGWKFGEAPPSERGLVMCVHMEHLILDSWFSVLGYIIVYCTANLCVFFPLGSPWRSCFSFTDTRQTGSHGQLDIGSWRLLPTELRFFCDSECHSAW